MKLLVAASTVALLLVTPGLRLAAGPFSLTITDNYVTPTFGAAQLSGGAGSNFAASTWESAANAALLRVRNSSMTGWNVTVHKVDTAGWAATTLTLEARRTGDGTGGATMSGGLSYQTITATDTFFFRGEGGNQRNIPVQYRIGNISVRQGAGTFHTTVYFTATEY